MEFKAIGKFLIIEPVFERYKGNILLPKYSPEYKQYYGQIYGIVLAIGEKSVWKNELNIGDKIIFQRHEGFRFIYERKMYLKLKDKWVLGLINDNTSF